MVFSNIFFIFRFLTVFLLIYYIVPYKYKNPVITVFSLIFYSWGEVKYFPIMIASTVVDFFCSGTIERHRDSKTVKNICLAISVMFNLGMLFTFKYTDFFISNINRFRGTSIPLTHLTLPLGISFYTFQTMSYTIDVYRGKVTAEKNLINFSAFVTMFPQLIAGPIVKYTDINEKLNTYEGRITLDGINEGIKLFIFGLGKKVLIANNVGALWTDIETIGFANVSTPLAWLGILAYALQIYFDFSGYSLMAIGLGKMIGFDFPQNFNLPYISKSITEFWRRWHMSLSSWFKEYVYIPLGGNRKGLLRQLINIAIVWALTGLWHGASWNFVLWGVYYGILLIIEKMFLLKILDRIPEKLRFIRHIYALFFVIVGWVIFNITDFSILGEYLKCMFGGGTENLAITAYYLKSRGAILIAAAIASTPLVNKAFMKLNSRIMFNTMRDMLETFVLLILFLMSIAFLVSGSYNPFLYFRF